MSPQSPGGAGRRLLVAVKAMVGFTLVVGVAYPAAVLALGLLVPDRAGGSLVEDAAGRVVGSSLVGQAFTGPDGSAMPEYFQSRPSAAGDGYDGGASSGSNLGPENADLVTAIRERRAAVAALEGVRVEAVPADAVTASGSGLDPHISPAYADLQVARVAEVRGLPATQVQALVDSTMQGPDLGFLGEERVNVLELNLALDILEQQE